MKKSNLKRLGLLCGILTLSSQLIYSMDIPALQERVQVVQREVRENAQRVNQAEGAIVVIGDAGASKSTLIHVLAQRELLVQENAAGFHIVAQNPLPGIEIGEVVGTRNPAAWYDEARRVAVWDCPGFNGPSNNLREIANVFSITQVFRNQNHANHANIKLVLAVKHSDLRDRPTNFLNVLKRLTDTFENNNVIEPSLSLVITQMSRANPLAILQERFDYCVRINRDNPEDVPLIRDTRVRDLFQYLARNAAQRVSYMSMADAVGAYVGGNRDQILNVIQNTAYMVDPVVNVALNPVQRGHMFEVGTNLIAGIVTQLSGPVSTALQNACEAIVDTRQLPTTAAQIKGTFGERLTLLNNINVQSSAQFLTTTTAFLQPFHLEGQLADVRTIVGCLEFCRVLDANFDPQIQAWSNSLDPLRQRILSLSNAPAVQSRIQLYDRNVDRTTTTFPAGVGRDTWQENGKILFDDVDVGAVPAPAPVNVAPAQRRHRTTEEKIVKAVVTKPLKQGKKFLKKIF